MSVEPQKVHDMHRSKNKVSSINMVNGSVSKAMKSRNGNKTPAVRNVKIDRLSSQSVQDLKQSRAVKYQSMISSEKLSDNSDFGDDQSQPTQSNRSQPGNKIRGY